MPAYVGSFVLFSFIIIVEWYNQLNMDPEF